VIHVRSEDLQLSELISRQVFTVFEKRGKLKKMVEEFEKKVMESALTHYKGNKTKTASELGLSRLGLRKKMIRYGLQDGKVSDYTNQAFK